MDTSWIDLVGEPVLKIVLAVALSGAIGYERQISDKPAGLRTNILIGLASALMMMVSIYVAKKFGGPTSDPARIAAQVVTGIGFLGAGTILQARGAVVGLTTAATIWAVAGIGLAVGSGLYELSVLSTAVVLLVLWAFGRVERKMLGKRATECLRLKVSNAAPLLKALNAIHADTGLRVEEWDVEESAGGGYNVRFCFSGSSHDRDRLRSLLAGLSGIDSVEPLGSWF